MNGTSLPSFHFLNGGKESASMNPIGYSEKELPSSAHARLLRAQHITVCRQAFLGRIGNKMETGFA